MKYFSLLMFVILMISACTVNSAKYSLPEGYKPCTSDNDCNKRTNEYCGFVGVDTYAVCRQ